LSCLKKNYVVVTLSSGNISMLVDISASDFPDFASQLSRFSASECARVSA